MRWTLLVAALLVPASALAAGGGEDGGGGAHFFWEITNLLMLAGILVYVGRKPVREYLDSRRSGIQDDIGASQKLLDDAETRLSEWNARAAQLDTEVERIKEIARTSAEQERARILGEAERAAEAIRRGASSTVDRELRRARQALRDDAADLAVELAGRILAEQVTDSDRARLVDEFVTRIEQSGTQDPEAA